MLKLTCREGFVLRQSRLHSGLAQVFLVLFALLAILAPGFDAPLSDTGFEAFVSAPADPATEAATLASATLSVAEDLEEEPDPEEAVFLTLAMLHCVPGAEHRSTDAGPSSSPYLSAHSCTGPPTL